MCVQINGSNQLPKYIPVSMVKCTRAYLSLFFRCDGQVREIEYDYKGMDRTGSDECGKVALVRCKSEDIRTARAVCCMHARHRSSPNPEEFALTTPCDEFLRNFFSERIFVSRLLILGLAGMSMA